MDIISTLSLLLDIPFVVQGWFGLPDFTGNASRIAKSARATRVSTQASKLIRVLRIIRLVRISKLYKYARNQIEKRLLFNRTS